MRIVSWNLDYSGHPSTHSDAWDFLRTLEPDIALLQEMVLPPSDQIEEHVVFEPGWDGRPWGSAILSRLGTLEVLWRDHTRGAVILARCDIPELGDTVIGSLHARIIEGRVIPSLRATLDAVRPLLSDSFILGGDLNTARAAGKAWPRNGHTELWEQLDGSILLDCYFAMHHEERQSYWREWLRNKPPTIGNSLMDDHVFVNEGWRPLLQACRVWDTRHVRTLSDHGPVVVDIRTG